MGANSPKEKAQQIPTDSSAESIRIRKKIFKEFDVNGNQWLSLAEIDKGLRDVLQFPEIFDNKPVIMRAYQVSIDKVRSKNPLTEGLVSTGMFKWILLYIRFYYEIWQDFQADRNGDHYELMINFDKVKQKKGYFIDIGLDSDALFQSLADEQNGRNSIEYIYFADLVVKQRLNNFQNLSSHDQI